MPRCECGSLMRENVDDYRDSTHNWYVCLCGRVIESPSALSRLNAAVRAGRSDNIAEVLVPRGALEMKPLARR